jgi:hypothetical protein
MAYHAKCSACKGWRLAAPQEPAAIFFVDEPSPLCTCGGVGGNGVPPSAGPGPSEDEPPKWPKGSTG